MECELDLMLGEMMVKVKDDALDLRKEMLLA
jgi:hypothetical protein